MVHIETSEVTNSLRQRWHDLAETPTRNQQRKPPELVVLQSPFRAVVTPILDYVLEQAKANPGRKIAVIVPALREKHWYHYVLHNQRGDALTALLTVYGTKQIVIINVPWYVES